MQQLSAVDGCLADGVCVLRVAENVFCFLLALHLHRSSQTAERSVPVNNDPVNMPDPSWKHSGYCQLWPSWPACSQTVCTDSTSHI